MLNKVLSKFRKKKAIIILSNEEKVKALSEKAIGLFDHMKKAHSELGTINEELQQIVDAEDKAIQEEIERHQRTLKLRTDNKVKALDEMQMNDLVKGELARFIR